MIPDNAVTSNARSGRICVNCTTSIPSLEADTICPRCGMGYPTICRIPILTTHPHVVLNGLRSYLDRPEESGAATDNQRARLAATYKRLAAARDARATNLALVRELVGRIPDCPNPYATYHFASSIAELGFTGWYSEHILPYFAQDWTDSPSFAHAVTYVISSMTRTIRERHSVCVLGAGACGLAYALADYFDKVEAFDLSALALVLAKRVIEGGEFSIRLRPPGGTWHSVAIRASQGPRRNVRFAVADALRIPLPDASQHAVVTQYLMDVVGNPSAIIAEIRRILAPGGVWINYSLPFRLPDEPVGTGKPGEDEIAVFLENAGFQVLENAPHRFAFLDFTSIDANAWQETQTVQFFAARSLSQPGDVTPPDRWIGWRRRDMSYDQEPIRFADGRSASFVRTVKLGRAGSSTIDEVSTGWGGRYEMDARATECLKQLLEAIDGSRNLVQIHDILRESNPEIALEELRQVLHFLSARDGLLHVGIG